VAAEVLNLAERSSNETKDMAERIRSIQKRVGDVVAASEAVTDTAPIGGKTRATLRNIVSVVDGTRNHVQSITAATEEMGRQVGTLNDVLPVRTWISQHLHLLAKGTG
jgi:methyl-accepting chemotaxis protein